jgi:hypothetical protein
MFLNSAGHRTFTILRILPGAVRWPDKETGKKHGDEGEEN